MRRPGLASRLSPALLAAALALLAAGRAGQARVVEKVAAVVGASIILASEVEEKAAPLLGDLARITDPGKRAARATALRRETLERLIDDQLISDQAAELRLSVTPEQVDSSIAEIKRQNNIDDKQLDDALHAQGMSMEAYRSDL